AASRALLHPSLYASNYTAPDGCPRALGLQHHCRCSRYPHPRLEVPMPVRMRPIRAWPARNRVTLAAMLILLGLAARPAHSQETLTGVVVEAATLRPVIGAQVQVVGSNRGAVTDNRGRFVIPGMTAGEQVTLRVVMIGYRELTQAVTVGAPDIVLALTASAISLDQIIVTGTPQQQQRRALGNSVGTVDVSRLVEVAPPPNAQRLMSSVPGVNVMSGGGDIGASANIRIRGASSITLSSEPLLYIDGVRVSNASR